MYKELLIETLHKIRRYAVLHNILTWNKCGNQANIFYGYGAAETEPASISIFTEHSPTTTQRSPYLLCKILLYILKKGSFRS